VQLPPSPVTSFLVGPNILLRTLFSNILRLCSMAVLIHCLEASIFCQVIRFAYL
jgi:hypothetical protein